MNATARDVATATGLAYARTCMRTSDGGITGPREQAGERGTMLRRLRQAASPNFFFPPLGQSMDRSKGTIRRPVPGHTTSPSSAFFASKT